MYRVSHVLFTDRSIQVITADQAVMMGHAVCMCVAQSLLGFAHSCHAESWTRTVEGIERGRDVCFCDREAETGGWRVGGGMDEEYG